MSFDKYDSHLKRIGGRPGEFLQIFLAKKLIKDFMLAKRNLNTVVEIGPGQGRIAEIMLNHGVIYSAFEPTSTMRQALESRFSEFKNFDCVYEYALPLDSDILHEKFDGLIAIHVLEHMPDSNSAVAFVSNCRDFLKEDGVALFVTPDFLDYKNLFWEIDWTHNYVTTVHRLKALMEATDLEIIYCRPIRGYAKSNLVRMFLKFIDFLIPYAFLDWILNRFLGHEKLASGFSVGFLKRNVYCLVRKKS